MTPWAVTDPDPERAAAELARRFPGCCVWLGEYTGRWWALARDRTGTGSSRRRTRWRSDACWKR